MSYSNKQQNSGKLLIFKLSSKKDNKPSPPYFSILGKVDDKWCEVDTATTVTGKLTKIVKKVGEFEGNEIISVQLFLKDEEVEENYIIETKLSMISRSLFNSLLSIDNFSEPITIDLFNNKKGYGSAAVRQGDQKIGWAFKIEDQPPVVKVKLRGKEISDFEAIDNFFLDKLVELGKELAGESSNAAQVEDEVAEPPQPVKEVKAPKSKVSTPKDPDLDEEDADGLPF